MTTHAPIPTVRRAAGALLAAVLLAGLGVGAVAADGENVLFYLHPVNSTVVAGHQVGFYVETDRDATTAEYLWYRNDVAIPGATSQFYRFTAQNTDHGARYHVTVKGVVGNKYSSAPAVAGPTPSASATLTVLPAGSALTPTITAPAGDTLIYNVSADGIISQRYEVFRATGNDLEWTYRYDNEELNLWHLLPAITIGAQAVRFNCAPPTTAASSLTVRVCDDAGGAVTRTWHLTQGALPPPTDVIFSAGPVDSTVVAGRQVAFLVYTNLHPVGPPAPSYQWYRNAVAIPGATTNPYSFIAQAGDDGARYHVVASGAAIEKNGGPSSYLLGPTASASATLTVLPAGSSLPPEIVTPEGDTLYASSSFTTGFRAVGHDLEWSYRYNTDAPDTWSALPTETTGSQYVRILIDPSGKTSITVRVIDDASVAATRTWALMRPSYPPAISAVTVSSNPVRWPGPVTLTVTASDPDGDALSYRYYVDYANSVYGGDAVFTPSANTCSVTFTKFGHYFINAVALDGKGGASQMLSPKIFVEPTFDVRTDVNGDGVVNALDLGLVSDNFGQVIP